MAQLFFQTFSNYIDRTTFLIIVFVGLIFAENFYQYRKSSKKIRLNSYLTNFFTMVFNNFVMSLLSVSSLTYVALSFSKMTMATVIPGFLWQVFISLLILDLSLYFLHRWSHNSNLLWMFHRVHHSDSIMNVMTSFRLNVVELVLITTTKIMLILMTGMSADVVLINETIITALTMFHHANISFPGEKFLGKFIVVPSFHLLHHSKKRSEHDSNYGTVFTLWDSALGTMKEAIPKKIGLSGVSNQTFFELLKYGFNWSEPEPIPIKVNSSYDIEHMVSEAAYYKALNRGFQHGNDFGDWFAAEREIKSQFGAINKNKNLHYN